MITVIANRMEMDGLDSRPAAGETNGGDDSVVFRVISAFESTRRMIYRVCGPFVAHLYCPFRATNVCGWPRTQGGARRLRRLALPWANLFCPFGARAVSWRMAGFFAAWPIRLGQGDSSGLGGPFGTRSTRSDRPHAPKGQ